MDFSNDLLMRELLEELLSEPYAKLCLFKFKNLEAVAEEIYQDSQILKSEHPLFSSFKKSQSILVLVLSHLELSGQSDFPKALIANLLDSTFSTSHQEHLTKLLSLLTTLEEQRNEALSPHSSVSISRLLGLEKSLEDALDCLRQMRSTQKVEGLAA